MAKSRLFVHAGRSPNSRYVFVGNARQRWLAGLKIYSSRWGICSFLGGLFQCQHCGMFFDPISGMACACRPRRER